MLNRKNLFSVIAGIVILTFIATAGAAAVEIDLEGIEEIEGLYMYDEITDMDAHEAMRERVREDAVPIAEDAVPEEPIEVAMIYPALDLSDSWARGYQGFIHRMDELEIPYDMATMGSGHAQHDVQRSHLETVLVMEYDYVIVGPTELYVQQDAIQEIVQHPDIEVIVWNYSTPLKEWGESREEGQPLSWVAFDHLNGAQMLGEYIVENYDSDKTAMMMYGVPGSTTAMRGYAQKQIMENHGMDVVYEHYADWDRELAYNATLDAAPAYEVDFIHSCSTAMTSGIISALGEVGMQEDVVVNGWGGGSEELEYMTEGLIEYTVFRNQDDWGVVLAEMIKLDLEGRTDEIPLAYSGEMQVIDHTMSEEEINELLEHGFRYSKDEMGLF